MNKNDKLMVKSENPNVYMYLTRVKCVGIVGIIIALFLIGFDVYNFEKTLFGIATLVIDVVLLVFSIYFIIRSNKLMRIELEGIVKAKTKVIKNTKKKTETKKKK